MSPIVSNDLGKATMREMMSLAALMLGSGMLIINENLSGTNIVRINFIYS